MRVAVLGAYGAVGHRLVAHARSLGHTTTAAGRDQGRLERVRADEHARLRIGDTDAVRALAGGHDVVVNATGVEDIRSAAATTSGGAAFMEISAESAHLNRLTRIETPRRPIASGIGLSPGLTNMLAVLVPGTRPIHIGLLGGVGDQHGDAGRAWVWAMAGRTVTSGGTVERVYRDARHFDVPGFGRHRLLRAAFGEQDQLAADLARPVATWLGLDPPWATSTLRIAGILPRSAAFLDRVSRPVGAGLRRYDRWAVIVTDGTHPAAWAGGRHEADATAIVAAHCLAPLTEAPPGVHPAYNLVSLSTIRSGLEGAGITIGSTAGPGTRVPDTVTPEERLRRENTTHAGPARRSRVLRLGSHQARWRQRNKPGHCHISEPGRR